MLLTALLCLFIYNVNGFGPSDIKYVHVVSSNHFDAGYTNYTLGVLNEYFDKYIPSIPRIYTELAQMNITFKFMEHAWVLDLYLNCPPNAGLHCPNNEAIKNFTNAINNQQITWYSFPFNSQLELYDQSMVQFGNYLSMKQFPSKFSTPHIPTTISQRDVPGMTRSMIPIFKRNGINAISIGANGRAAPANIPDIFRWYDPKSNEEIITIYHPGGYGGTDIKSCVIIDNFTHSLATYWNGDNAGPPSVTNIVATLNEIQKEFPNAQVVIDTFESFVTQLMKKPDIVSSLPVFNKEMGDNWVYGPPSDPLKLAKFRSAQRLRTQCLLENKCNLQSDTFFNFSRFLLENGEHTFGGSYSFIGSSFSNNIWTNEELNMALTTQPYKTKFESFRETWYEQRKFGIDYALQALSLSKNINEINLYKNILNEFNYLDNTLIPNLNDKSQWEKIHLTTNYT